MPKPGSVAARSEDDKLSCFKAAYSLNPDRQSWGYGHLATQRCQRGCERLCYDECTAQVSPGAAPNNTGQRWPCLDDRAGPVSQ